MDIIKFRENIRQSFNSVRFDIDFDRKSFFATCNNNIFTFLNAKEQEEISILSFREKRELKNKLLEIYWSLEDESRNEWRRLKCLQNRNLFLYGRVS